MLRVLRPGGRLAVLAWDDLANSPGYATLVTLLERMAGQAAADGLRAPFVLGEILEGAEEDLSVYVTPDGGVSFPTSAHIVSGRRA
jgi:hypothetical protein